MLIDNKETKYWFMPLFDAKLCEETTASRRLATLLVYTVLYHEMTFSFSNLI